MSRAQECLENAQRCETLARLQSDPVVKAGLLEAARKWRDRQRLIEMAQNRPNDYWGKVLNS
jgi:hypothetical protein